MPHIALFLLGFLQVLLVFAVILKVLRGIQGVVVYLVISILYRVTLVGVPAPNFKGYLLNGMLVFVVVCCKLREQFGQICAVLNQELLVIVA